MKYSVILFLVLFVIASCNTGKGIFGGKSLHEQYGQKLKTAGLDQTELGRLWFSAAEGALASPHPVAVPYKETGYFAAEKPRAVGLRFTAKRGEKLLFQLDKTPPAGFTLYAELW